MDAEQSIAEGFKALSAGRPQAALEAVNAVDADSYPRASLLAGHAHKALGQHAAAESAYRALTEKPDDAIVQRVVELGWFENCAVLCR